VLDNRAFEDRRQLISEAEKSLMEVRATSVEATAVWPHTMPPRGGFILTLNP